MWAIFKGKISNKDAFSKENIYKTREYVDYIVERLSSKDLLFRLTVLKVIKYLKSRINFDAEKINYWLDKLNPDFLSEEVSYYEIEGKRIAYPSNKEDWYALKSKSGEKLEMYSECLRVSEEAISIFSNLNNGNDIWLKRRIAISKHNLGYSGEAINILNDLLKFKKDWFIYKDVSDIYFSLGNYENAIEYAIESVLKPGEDDKKINLFFGYG